MDNLTINANSVYSFSFADPAIVNKQGDFILGFPSVFTLPTSITCYDQNNASRTFNCGV